MDVLWFRLPRHADDTAETQGRFDAGRVFVMLNRGEYWQCALVIPKGANERIRDEGLAAFQQTVAAVPPFDPQRVQAITNFDDVKLLTVKVDRLKRWARPGFVCIGDAAHAMSPIGGVGINLAIQDAVAAANIIAEPLRQNRLTFEDLEKIQARRQWPTEMTQRVQLLLQNAVIGPTLKASGELKPPLLLRVIAGVPFLNRFPARVLGLGFRPEHVSQAIR
jgi:2-polyprenyl-6-methoxyphenol hydroxylase-like FAD-dependent oxidoreductase